MARTGKYAGGSNAATGQTDVHPNVLRRTGETGDVDLRGVRGFRLRFTLPNSLREFCRIFIPDDGSSTSTWPDRFRFVYNHATNGPTDTGGFNEYGELRADPAKTSTVALRCHAHTSGSSGDIFQVAHMSNTPVYMGVSSSACTCTVPVIAPNIPTDVIRLTDSAAVNASTTLVNDDVLTMTLGIGTWIINGCIAYAAEASADMKTQFNFSGTCTSVGSAMVTTTSATTSATGSMNSASRAINTNFTAGGVDSTAMAIPVWLLVTVTVAGTFVVQYAQSSSQANDVKLLAGSHLSYRKVNVP